MRRTRVLALEQTGSTRAKAVAKLRASPERFLATIAVGVTVVSSTAAAFGGASVAARLGETLSMAGAGKYSQQIALGLVVLGISFAQIVLGELVPKSLALRSAESYSLLAAKPLLAIAWLSRPIVWLLSALSNAFLRMFGDSTNFIEARMSPDELRQLVQEAGKSGQMDPGASELATRALDFERLSVQDAMVPREGMILFAKSAATHDVTTVLAQCGHARVPVYEDSRDNIVGYVTARDVFHELAEKRSVALPDILRTAYFVPESMRAIDVLRELQRRRVHLAIVVDDAGTVRGLVTIEDLVEELVGEIVHEHETVVETIVREASGTSLVLGQTTVREVNRALSLSLEEPKDRTTMAALAIDLAGEIPKAGAKVTAADGTMIEIVEASPRKVLKVRLHPKGVIARTSAAKA